jgi:hypothetical protein
MEKFISMIKQILYDEKHSKKENVFNLIEIINNYNHDTLEDDFSDILVELSQDLEYYVADPKLRREDPSYYGEEKLEKLLKEALGKIEKLIDETKAE